MESRIKNRLIKEKCTPKKCLREDEQKELEEAEERCPESPQFNLIPEFIEHVEWTKQEAGYIVGP